MIPDRNERLPAPLRRGPLAIAHRGGALLPANLGKENTLEAFANAVDLGYRYLETDVRTTRDGEIFAFHDPDLQRMVGRPVKFADLTAAQVRQIEMADGAQIVSLKDLLLEFPDAIFNIDFKDDAAAAIGLEQIRAQDADDRVVVASFSHARLMQVRRRAPHLATSASQVEVLRVLIGRRPRSTAKPVALQIPMRFRGVRILTQGLIHRAHRHGLQVHVWTVDDADVMRRILDMGVDGIITDRPDTLKEVLLHRGQWHA